MARFFSHPPTNFSPQVEVATVFIEWEGNILLLQRAPHKLAPNLWAVPGGKLEVEEKPIQGLIREIYEELSLSPAEEELQFVANAYVEHALMDYILHLFRWPLGEQPQVILNPEEHQNYRWLPQSQFTALPLIECQLEAFQCVYGQQSKKS